MSMIPLVDTDLDTEEISLSRLDANQDDVSDEFEDNDSVRGGHITFSKRSKAWKNKSQPSNDIPTPKRKTSAKKKPAPKRKTPSNKQTSKKKTSKKRASKKKGSKKRAERAINDGTWEDGDISEVQVPKPPPIPFIDEVMTPVEYFEHFFDDTLISAMVSFTNSYSNYVVMNSSKRTKHERKLLNVTVPEMRQFLGIWIYMGVMSASSLRDYWAADTYVSQVAEIMTRDRFQSIRSSLHFYDKSDEELLDKEDRFRKISFLLNYIREKCLRLEQEEKFSIDEVMVPYKGTFAGSLRQYLKDKPHKFGIKIFALAGVSGIIYDFFPYAGSSTFLQHEFSPAEKDLGFGAQVVIALTRSIKKPAESALFFDNWYTSFKLVSYLKEKFGIVATGTAKANRIDNCPLKEKEELEEEGRGAYDSKMKGQVQVTKWLDRKVVHVVSSQAGAHPLGIANRSVPTVITVLNLIMRL